MPYAGTEKRVCWYRASLARGVRHQLRSQPPTAYSQYCEIQHKRHPSTTDCEIKYKRPPAPHTWYHQNVLPQFEECAVLSTRMVLRQQAQGPTTFLLDERMVLRQQAQGPTTFLLDER
eukprot:1896636-Rhodomonas_salina.1